VWHSVERGNVGFNVGAKMRTIGRLTFNKVKNAKPQPGGKTVLLCDGGGLWLQVSAGKDGQVNRSWLFRYALAETKISRTGRQYRRERQMGLGSVHTVTLADARELAREARLLVLRGEDPLQSKQTSRAAAQASQARRKTFNEVAEAYLQKFEDGWKNAQHRTQWRTTLKQFILPVLGKLDVEAIDTEAVLKVLEPIWSAIPETASRIRGRIEVVLDFAGRNGSNPARWTGHLEHRLAKRNKARTVQHLPALPYAEIAAFMSELRTIDGIPARALELTILCATRTNETMGARWGEFDLEARLWVIPAARTKRDREHRVPLSDAAVAVLKAMAAIRRDDRVFPVGIESMRHCLQRLRPDATTHGFRATFRSWAGGCTTHPRDVCETALGHSVGSAVEAAYQRDALVAKRRVLMSDWAEFCAGDRSANVLRVQRPAPESESTNIGGNEIRQFDPAVSR
jgi:integrase